MIPATIDMSPEIQPWVLIGLDVTAKSLLLLAIGLATAALLGRKRLLTRSALWNACVLGLLVLPFTSMYLPRLRIPILPAAPIAAPAPAVAPVEMAIAPISTEMVQPVTTGTITPSTQELAPPPRQIDWVLVGILVYAGGVALLALRLLVGILEVRRLRRSSGVVYDPLWQDTLKSWTHRLGTTCPVQLLHSRRVSVPVAFGWLRPAVVIPESMLDAPISARRSCILLHELAHIRRRDYLWQILLKCAQVFYWPNPLIWLAGRLIAANREEATDALCVYHASSPSEYHLTLLEVAQSLVRRPAATLGIAMARTPRIAQRLERIDRGSRLAQCLAGRPTRIAVALAALSLAGVIGASQLAARDLSEDPSKRSESAARLKQVATALYTYTNDTPLSLQALVEKKIISQEMLISPVTPKATQPSYIFVPRAGRDDIRDVIMYENPANYQNKGTNVCYGDAHANWEVMADFRKSLAATFRRMGRPVPTEYTQEAINAAVGQAPATQPARMRYFVLIVVGEDRLTFEGQDATWEQVHDKLAALSNLKQTVLTVAVDNPDVPIGRFHESLDRAGHFVSEFGMEYVSDVGVHPLGTKGGPAQTLPPDQPQQARSSVLLVVGKDRMTFQGQDATWEEVQKQLAGLPDPRHTVFEIAVESPDVTTGRFNEAQYRGSELIKKYGLEHLSEVGEKPLGSKSGPPQPLPASPARPVATPASSSPPPGSTRIRLKSGAEVEFLGVRALAEGNAWWAQKWWGLDGQPLKEPPCDTLDEKSLQKPGPDERKYQFAVRIVEPKPKDKQGKPDIDCNFGLDAALGVSSTSAWKHELSREPLPGVWALAGLFPANQKTTAVTVGIAAGPWETRGKSEGNMLAMSSGGVQFAFTAATEVKGAASVTVSDRESDRACRIIAIDKKDRIHESDPPNSVSSAGTRVTQAFFTGLALKEVKEFQYQTRAYERISFPDVPLQPGPRSSQTPKSDATGSQPASRSSQADAPRSIRPSANGVIGFAIIVRRMEPDGRRELAEDLQKQYKAELAAHGPQAAQQFGNDYRWFELSVEDTSQTGIQGEYAGHKYLLVHAQPPKGMFTSPNDRSWGITAASIGKGYAARPALNIELDQRGATLLSALSKANMNQPLACIAGGRIVMIATIRSEISKTVQVVGSFTENELRQIQAQLSTTLPKAEAAQRESASASRPASDGDAARTDKSPDEVGYDVLGVLPSQDDSSVLMVFHHKSSKRKSLRGLLQDLPEPQKTRLNPDLVVELFRQDSGEKRALIYQAPLSELLAEKEPTVMLEHGDQLRIVPASRQTKPETQPASAEKQQTVDPSKAGQYLVYISGRVTRAGVYSQKSDDRITLSRLIIAAGGPETSPADHVNIRVTRQDFFRPPSDKKSAIVLETTMEALVKPGAADPVLEHGDVVQLSVKKG